MELSKSPYLKLKSQLKDDYLPEVDHQDGDYREALAEVLLARNQLLLLVRKDLTDHQMESDAVRLSQNPVDLQNFQKLNICSGLK